MREQSSIEYKAGQNGHRLSFHFLLRLDCIVSVLCTSRPRFLRFLGVKSDIVKGEFTIFGRKKRNKANSFHKSTIFKGKNGGILFCGLVVNTYLFIKSEV